jgi:hypothetical protein
MLALGLLSLAAASDRTERNECGPFTFGKSAFGGCDWFQ